MIINSLILMTKFVNHILQESTKVILYKMAQFNLIMTDCSTKLMITKLRYSIVRVSIGEQGYLNITVTFNQPSLSIRATIYWHKLIKRYSKQSMYLNRGLK
jgi:hypothetical protein